MAKRENRLLDAKVKNESRLAPKQKLSLKFQTDMSNLSLGCRVDMRHITAKKSVSGLPC
jgi:hypothetical protein